MQQQTLKNGQWVTHPKYGKGKFTGYVSEGARIQFDSGDIRDLVFTNVLTLIDEPDPTPTQQSPERMTMLCAVLEGCKHIQSQLGKGKTANVAMMAYISGFVEGKGGSPDPVLYFAVMRGGNPMPEIEKFIKENS